MTSTGPSFRTTVLTLLGAFLIIASLPLGLAAQAQPGRILSAPGNNNIIECNLDASNCFTVVANQISPTNGVGFTQANNPSVASNGTIAFTSLVDVNGNCDGTCNPHVFIMNADGTNVRQLTFNPANTSGYNGEFVATISPDATMVAFQTNTNAAPDGSHPYEIYLVNADGSNLRQLTPFTGGPDPSQSNSNAPAWSPDSSMLAYRGVVYTSVCGTYGGSPIYVRVIGAIHADGSNQQILACDNNDGYVTAIDWSPDGTLLSWARNVQHGAQGCSGCVGEPAIAFIDFSGQNRYSAGITSTQLSGAAGGDSCQDTACIHFSPDSTMLAYKDTFRDGTYCYGGPCYISIINLHGTNKTETSIPVGGEMWWMGGPGIPAPASMTLAPTTLEFWPGFSQQLVPSLLDGNGDLILHTAQSYNFPFVYAAMCIGHVGPYGLMTGSIYPGDTASPSYVNASNAGLTSNTIPFKCWPSQPCNYSLAFSSGNFGGSGGLGSVSVIADPGQNNSACPWNAVSNAPWITITSPPYGSGAGSTNVSFTVAGNSTAQARQGTITINPAGTLTVSQNAAPAITSLSPPSAVAGGAAFTLTVNGARFIGSSTVNFNGSPRATTFVNATQITASISAADIAVAGWDEVSVSNPAPGWSQSNDATFTVSTGSSPPPPGPALHYVPVTPCRVADTRNPNGPFGGPTIAGGTSRDFVIPNSACNIPPTAAAYSLNVAVVPSGPLGYLTVWPTGEAQPLVATTNSVDGRVKSTAAIVPAGTNGAISVFAANTTNVVLDINGYFVLPATNPNALAFYAVTPCRVADTRNAVGPLGGPSLVGGQSRTFSVPTSACNLPVTAQAYSLNFTAVPKGPLGFLTAWPTGQAQPLVATLNAVTGTVTANAGLVPAGTNGDIDVFASNDTDLVIDVNGYFAPAAPGGLSLHNLAPCRVLDTRQASNGQAVPAFSVELDVNATASGCGAPAGAQAYVFNATVVPTAALGYLTMWAQGTVQPLVATLNAVDAAVTNNMAIVPTTNGSVSVFASNPTHLVLDISGYFAP